MSARWQNLVAAIRRLPGVGPKMAERMSLHLLRTDDSERLIHAIIEARQALRRCALCGMFTEAAQCERCGDSRREQRLLCVVEEVADLEAMERSGAYRGHYHLLGGALSPLDGVGPRELRIEPLVNRLKNSQVEEVILATNPTVEGEATATYLAQLIHPLGKKITRLAYGLPSGANIEYADELTLCRAFEGRTEV